MLDQYLYMQIFGGIMTSENLFLEEDEFNLGLHSFI